MIETRFSEVTTEKLIQANLEGMRQLVERVRSGEDMSRTLAKEDKKGDLTICFLTSAGKVGETKEGARETFQRLMVEIGCDLETEVGQGEGTIATSHGGPLGEFTYHEFPTKLKGSTKKVLESLFLNGTLPFVPILPLVPLIKSIPATRRLDVRETAEYNLSGEFNGRHWEIQQTFVRRTFDLMIENLGF